MANNQLIKFCCFSKSSRSTGRWNSWQNKFMRLPCHFLLFYSLLSQPVFFLYFGTFKIRIKFRGRHGISNISGDFG